MLRKIVIVLWRCFWRVLSSISRLVCMQGQNKGGKGGHFPGCRFTAGDVEKSQQYSTFAFERSQVRTWGRQTSCPRSHLTSLRPCMHVLCVCVLRELSGFLGTRSGFFGEDRLATLLNSKHSRTSFSTHIISTSFTWHLCSTRGARVDTHAKKNYYIRKNV